MTDKDKMRMWRHQLGDYAFAKSKKYLKWLKEQYPGLDLHHILASYNGKKFTDYLVFPIAHEFHLNVVEKNRPKYFSLYLEASIRNLVRYKDYLEGGEKYVFIIYEDYSVEGTKKLIKEVQQLEKIK